MLSLRLCDVGLVERVDAEQPAGDRRGVLPEQELRARAARRPCTPAVACARTVPSESRVRRRRVGRSRARRRSTTTGRRPVPCLPVDSAMSCSAQSPKPTMPEPASASTTLSRPAACGRAERRAEREAGVVVVLAEARQQRLGLVEQGGDVDAGQRRRAPGRTRSARCSGRRRSGRRGRRGSPRLAARFSSGEPGSVTTTMRLARVDAGRRGTPARRPAGGCRSRPCRRSCWNDHDRAVEAGRRAPPAPGPGRWCRARSAGRRRWRQITSGASDEPPMPASTTWSRPSAGSSLAQLGELGQQLARLRGRSSQPSRIAASGSASGPHRVGVLPASPAARRRCEPGRPSSRPVASPPSATGARRTPPPAAGRAAARRAVSLGRASLLAVGSQLLPARSARAARFQRASNFSTPSSLERRRRRRRSRCRARSSVVEHLLRLGVGAGTVSPRDLAVVGDRVEGRLRHGVDRAGGDQLGRRRSCRVDGSLTPVEAHSGRCGVRAGRRQRLPAVGGEDLLVELVGQPRVGDRGLALAAPWPRRCRSCRAACRPRCRRGRRRTTRPTRCCDRSWPWPCACSRPSRKASMTAR